MIYPIYKYMIFKVRIVIIFINLKQSMNKQQKNINFYSSIPQKQQQLSQQLYLPKNKNPLPSLFSPTQQQSQSHSIYNHPQNTHSSIHHQTGHENIQNTNLIIKNTSSLPNSIKTKSKKQLKKQKLINKQFQKIQSHSQQKNSAYNIKSKQNKSNQQKKNNKISAGYMNNNSKRLRLSYKKEYLQVDEVQGNKLWGQIDQIYYKKSQQLLQSKQNISKFEFKKFQLQSCYNQMSYFPNYKMDVLYQNIPQLKQDKNQFKIKTILQTVGNKQSNQSFLIFYQIQNQQIQSLQTQNLAYLNDKNEDSKQLNIDQERISNKNQNNLNLKQIDCISLQYQGRNPEIIDTKLLKCDNPIKLKQTGIIKLQQMSQRLIAYNNTFYNKNLQTDIQKQIGIWKWQLNEIQKENQLRWATKIQSPINYQYNQQLRKNPYSQSEVDFIHKKLIWSNILKLFKQGYSDKTSDVFEFYKIQQKQSLETKKIYRPSATKGTNQDYLKHFQTDCKICFCSSNFDNNKVLYCDSCNTSYHQYCYGLNSIPKTDKYYCDSCFQQKKSQLETKNKFRCKICWRKSFPMKNLNGHFYHVTCLILNDLVQINNKQLCLKPEISFQKITQMVIKSELNQNYCQFCVQLQGCQNGLQFKCYHCNKTFHPICAYLNGCMFIINIQKQEGQLKLSVKIYCNDHHPQRDHIQQIYYRRYVCNFKKTSQMDFKSFLKSYKIQEEDRQKFKKKAQNQNINNKINLLKVTQAIKVYHKQLKYQEVQKIPTQTSKLIKKQKLQSKKTQNKPFKSFFSDD